MQSNNSTPTVGAGPSAERPQAPQPPIRWRPSYRAVRTMVMLILVVIVLAVIGVRSLLRRGEAPATGSTAVAADAAEVCSAGAHLHAEPYKARTNQPMALYARSATDAKVSYRGVYVLGVAPIGSDLQEAYTAVGKNLTRTFSGKQTPVLVGCITRTHETLTDQVCQYTDGKNVPVYNALYYLMVYEASTRRVVAKVSIPTTSAYDCGSFAAYDGKGFYRSWDTATVATALAPLIQ